MATTREILDELARGLPLDPLPPAPSMELDPSVPHAPIRHPNLTVAEEKVRSPTISPKSALLTCNAIVGSQECSALFSYKFTYRTGP